MPSPQIQIDYQDMDVSEQRCRELSLVVFYRVVLRRVMSYRIASRQVESCRIVPLLYALS